MKLKQNKTLQALVDHLSENHDLLEILSDTAYMFDSNEPFSFEDIGFAMDAGAKAARGKMNPYYVEYGGVFFVYVDYAQEKLKFDLEELEKDSSEGSVKAATAATGKLAQEVEHIMSELVLALTDEVTGINGRDEEQLQEYGENSYFGEHGRQQEIAYHEESISSLKKLFKTYTLPKDVKAFEDLLKKIQVALSMTEAQLWNAGMQNILEALEEHNL